MKRIGYADTIGNVDVFEKSCITIPTIKDNYNLLHPQSLLFIDFFHIISIPPKSIGAPMIIMVAGAPTFHIASGDIYSIAERIIYRNPPHRPQHGQAFYELHLPRFPKWITPFDSSMLYQEFY